MGDFTVNRMTDPLDLQSSLASDQDHSLKLSSDATVDTLTDTGFSSPSPELSHLVEHGLPPTVAFILRDIQNRTSKAPNPDHDASGQQKYHLEDDDWVILEQYLPENLRYSYLPQTQTFVHEMPTDEHEVCLFLLSIKLIYGALILLCQTASEKEWLDSILNYGATGIKGKDRGARQADAYFYHSKSTTLHQQGESVGVVLEISVTQSRDELKKKVIFFLEEAFKKPRVVIGIDFDYPNTKKVTLLTWRRPGKKIICKTQVLRDEDGNPSRGEPLRIFLSDLGPQDLLPSSLRGKAIELSVDEMNKRMLSRVDESVERRAQPAPTPQPSNTQPTPEPLPPINLRGTVDLIRLTAPHLALNEPWGPDGERGIIVVVASVAAYEGQVGQLAYSASKGAVRSIVLPLARELGQKAGIRVMGIAPGVFQTGMTTPPQKKPQSGGEPQPTKKEGAKKEKGALVQERL